MTIDECQKLYDSVINDLKNLIEEDSFNQLSLETKKVSKYLNGYIYVAVDDYALFFINKFYIKKINNLIQKYTEETVMIKFVNLNELKTLNNNEEVTPTSVEPDLENKYRPGNIDATFTFTNFVVGKSNKFAYTYAIQTAENPGKNFNPLYIFGGVGIGKTHLMQAIGNYMLDKDINKKVLYISAKEFCDDYIHACNYSQAEKQKKIDEFHNRYRDIDVLLVDDIQILCGKDKTQEEFFTLFNFLIDRNKQIVITCDKPANSLEGMADRLKSRFDQGLTVDINAPELELRIEILKKKSKTISNKDDIPDEVLNYIASNFQSNIRELEGALKRVIFYSAFLDSPATLDLAKESLVSLIKSQKNANRYSNNIQSYENIQSVVSAYFGVTVSDLISSKRSAKITLPRHISMYLIKELYDLPLKKIGSLFGGRDHTTVMSACEKIESDLKTNKDLQMAVDNIKKKLNI